MGHLAGEAWAPYVQKLALVEDDGCGGGAPLGHLYLDLYSRRAPLHPPQPSTPNAFTPLPHRRRGELCPT